MSPLWLHRAPIDGSENLRDASRVSSGRSQSAARPPQSKVAHHAWAIASGARQLTNQPASTYSAEVILRDAEKLLLHPFRPVRVHTSDGKSYPIPHRDFFTLFQHKLSIFVPSKRPGVMANEFHVALMHITAIEELPQTGRNGGRKSHRRT